MEAPLKLVAITNCPAGIAHTSTWLPKRWNKSPLAGNVVKVETQGANGSHENRLLDSEIAAADYVILAIGRGLNEDDRARFAGKKFMNCLISASPEKH